MSWGQPSDGACRPHPSAGRGRLSAAHGCDGWGTRGLVANVATSRGSSGGCHGYRASQPRLRQGFMSRPACAAEGRSIVWRVHRVTGQRFIRQRFIRHGFGPPPRYVGDDGTTDPVIRCEIEPAEGCCSQGLARARTTRRTVGVVAMKRGRTRPLRQAGGPPVRSMFHVNPRDQCGIDQSGPRTSRFPARRTTTGRRHLLGRELSTRRTERRRSWVADSRETFRAYGRRPAGSPLHRHPYDRPRSSTAQSPATQ